MTSWCVLPHLSMLRASLHSTGYWYQACICCILSQWLPWSSILVQKKNWSCEIQNIIVKFGNFCNSRGTLYSHHWSNILHRNEKCSNWCWWAQQVVNSLTAKSLPAGTKTPSSQVCYIRIVRISYVSYIVHPTKTTTMVKPLPLRWHGFSGSAWSNARATRPRCWPRPLCKGIVFYDKVNEDFIYLSLPQCVIEIGLACRQKWQPKLHPLLPAAVHPIRTKLKHSNEQ